MISTNSSEKGQIDGVDRKCMKKWPMSFRKHKELFLKTALKEKRKSGFLEAKYNPARGDSTM